jgi:septum formation protein
MQRFSNYDIILASNSPRRQQFLKDIGLDFRIKTHSVEEIYPEELKAAEISDYLVKLKAEPFKSLTEKQLVITADTIVWHNNQCLGKPKDRAEAVQMLQQLSEEAHQVVTSVAFTQAHQQKVIHQVSTVYFKALTATEIDYYIDNYQPFDKAGAYGIQEWIGTVGIVKIEGSYTNIVGLPVAQVLATLEKICIK